MQLRAAEDVCYAWQKYPQDQPNTLLAGTNSGGNNASAACGAHQFSRNDNATVTPTHNVLDVHTPIRTLGPIDFTHYLRTRYPNLVR